jgi:hypothetical protein
VEGCTFWFTNRHCDEQEHEQNTWSRSYLHLVATSGGVGGHRDEQEQEHEHEHEQSTSSPQHEEEAGHREEQGTWSPKHEEDHQGEQATMPRITGSTSSRRSTRRTIRGASHHAVGSGGGRGAPGAGHAVDVDGGGSPGGAGGAGRAPCPDRRACPTSSQGHRGSREGAVPRALLCTVAPLKYRTGPVTWKI